MDVTAEQIRAVGTGLRSEFNAGFEGVEPKWSRFATRVNSTKGSETYSWLGDFPMFREWVGDRRIKALREKVYRVVNRDYECSVGINKNRFEDDELATFGALSRGYGKAAAENPDVLCFEALKAGFTTECYDGQNFFDAEHPVGDDGALGLRSNFQDGASEAWYLMVTTRALKPIIYQDRKKPNFIMLGDDDDPNVFLRNEIVWGAHSREAAGHSFWQLAFASKAPLTADNYEAARAAIMTFTDDEGRPLGLMPDTLAVGPSNDGEARELLTSARLANGADNKWKGTAEILLSPRLMGA